ncbi:MAG: restriction endonuclease subunit S [Saprospiraceae bacterium]|nr:restriction endonuclease subunit S [Candidatus Vicinibacter affinis]
MRKFFQKEHFIALWESIGKLCAEQHRIVARIEELFSSLGKGIEALKTAQQQLKVYRQAVLKYAFEGRLTNPNLQEGELPEGWVNANLGLIKEFSMYGPRFSSDEYSNDGVAILRTSDISENGKVDWANAPKLILSENEYEKYKLIQGDLLITRTGSIGTVSVFNDNKRAIAGAFLIYYRLKPPINMWYIYYFLKSFKAQKHFKKFSSGVGRPNLNVPNIELLHIPIPDIQSQNQIVQEIESRLSVCDKIEENITQSLQQAEALRQSILKKAFEGKLVPQDPSDEPTSVLLERIKAKKEKIKPENAVRKKKV